MSVLTASGKYLVSIPMDPQQSELGNSNSTGYSISKDANGRVTVSAPHPEQNATISVTR